VRAVLYPTISSLMHAVLYVLNSSLSHHLACRAVHANYVHWPFINLHFGDLTLMDLKSCRCLRSSSTYRPTPWLASTVCARHRPHRSPLVRNHHRLVVLVPAAMMQYSSAGSIRKAMQIMLRRRLPSVVVATGDGSGGPNVCSPCSRDLVRGR
jgi:hypothetical protein